MTRGDHTFVVSLVASLLAHGVLLATMAARLQTSPAPLAAVPPQPRPAGIFIEESNDASLEFGDPNGRGNAANSAPGDEPMIGRDGDQTQAFLSRDPVGPGRVGDDPSMSVLPKGAAEMPKPPSAAAAMVGVASPMLNLTPPKTAQAPPMTSAGQDATSLMRTKNSPVAAPESNADGVTGSSATPADPAVMSDSESDPFAPGMKVEFRDGSVDARLGRKVKTVRPKLNLASRYDLQSTFYPSMQVRVRIDAEGAVRKVEIVKSSGSAGADQAVEVALYQWWFEPKKDAAGRAIASEMTFPIVWR